MRPPVSRRQVLRLGGATLVLAGTGGLMAADLARRIVRADVVVYGATAAGIVAAVQAGRMGRTAVVVEPSDWAGGVTTGGLTNTDVGNGLTIGGLAREFYQRVQAISEGTALKAATRLRFAFEPHVAQAVFDQMLAEVGGSVYFGLQLHRVEVRDRRITRLVTTDHRTFEAKMYIDASYEGDLMAMAGVRCTVGREGNGAYDERFNGVQLDLTPGPGLVSPYRMADRPSSGLLPGVAGTVAPNGSPDALTQAYNFRMCLTQATDRIPFPKPEGYDPDDYELLWRWIERGNTGPFFNAQPVGGGKSDVNNEGPFSTDHVGASHHYATASPAARASIVAEHRRYQQGLMWFLANDPRLPDTVRAPVRAWGLPTDEFVATGGWPPQLYVREARRMVSAFVMTEHHCLGRLKAPEPVGLASYPIDFHSCQRVVVEAGVVNEGHLWADIPAPYPIGYRSIVPSAAECTNLLAPVCLSASHVAYGSIRMEPVYMILAQSAATAAVLAGDRGIDIQRLGYDVLAPRLLADGQLLEWSGPVVDNALSKNLIVTGSWVYGDEVPGFYGYDYVHDGNTGKGTKRFQFTAAMPRTGVYIVYMRWTASRNRASNVPVDIVHAGGVTTVRVDQRSRGGEWVALGSFPFQANQPVRVVVRTDGTDGYVVADAVRFAAVRG
jgi:hypothetical protein